jgi:hypothetical protein
MSNIKIKQAMGYGAVVLSGGQESLRMAAQTLQSEGYTLSKASSHSVVLHDVRDQQLDYVVGLAEEHQLEVRTHGRNVYAEPMQEKIRHAFKLSLQPRRWYFAENLEDQSPLVFVRDVTIERLGEAGDEAQVITMELHAPDGTMPTKQRATSQEAAAYGLRPALPEDFEQLGWMVPDAQHLAAVQVEDNHLVAFLDNVSIDD